MRELSDLVQVLPLGRFVYTDPTITQGRRVVWDITSADVAAMVASKDKTDVVVDYEHQTLKGEEAPAAGWITELVDGGERGLLGRIRWTPRAKELLRTGQYRYVSPVVLRNTPSKTRSGEVDRAFLHSVALTNRPYLPTIEPLDGQEERLMAKHAARAGMVPLTQEELDICRLLGVTPMEYAMAKGTGAGGQEGDRRPGIDEELARLFDLSAEDQAKHGGSGEPGRG